MGLGAKEEGKKNKKKNLCQCLISFSFIPWFREASGLSQKHCLYEADLTIKGNNVEPKHILVRVN